MTSFGDLRHEAAAIGGYGKNAEDAMLKGLGADAISKMQEAAKETEARQATTSETLKETEESASPIFRKVEKQRKTEKPVKGRVNKASASAEKAKALLPLKRIKDSASEFESRNPELKAPVLVALRERITPQDTVDTILEKVLSFYPDGFLANEGLDFLLETTEGLLQERVQIAKEILQSDPNNIADTVNGINRRLETHLNAEEFAFFKLGNPEEYRKYARNKDLAIGANITEFAREAAGKGIGDASSLRGLYKDITGAPRQDSAALFQELSQRYQFRDLKKVIAFLLHSLGADMKAPGPSIEGPKLQVLFQETRSLQAVMGVYRYFQSRIPLIEKLFHKA